MNAKKSLIIWIVYIVVFVLIFLAFIKGTNQEGLLKLAWMGGAIVAAILAIFIAVRLNRAKR